MRTKAMTAAFATAAMVLACSSKESPSDPGGGGIRITASGESLALSGYAFPPASPGDPAFVDGWEVKLEHLIATIDKITLSEGPDTAPGDPSRTGKVVAEVDGPFAVDLAVDGPGNIDGAGDPGTRAVPIATLTKQNRNGDAPFATDGTRYAFGFDVVAAAANAQNVNLSGDANDAYKQMTADGCTVLYVGTATFKGTSCTSTTDTGAGDEFAKLPKSVKFRLCFKAPTSYLNCQNGLNDPAQALPGESHQRGIAFKANTFVLGQVTIHTDHPFWESTEHDSPAHFDTFAAQAVGKGDGAVTLDALKGVDIEGWTDAQGASLPWRSCLSADEYTPPSTGTMRFDAHGVAIVGPNGDPTKGLRDAYDFVTYNQSTQGHLNIGDGLCFVARHYPSPP